VGALRNQGHNDPSRFGGVSGTDHSDSVRLEGGGRPLPAGLVRNPPEGDARGVVVALTDADLIRLTETAPVNLRGVAELFVTRLDDQELAALESILDKVTVDCGFG